MCASSSSSSSSWGEWHAYSHLLILFSPMNTNQKIVRAKLSASILRKHGSDWFKYPGFHSLCEESQENCYNDPYFSLCLILTAEKPSRGPLNRFSKESFLWVGSFERLCRIDKPIRQAFVNFPITNFLLNKSHSLQSK